jgi:hypothetical protein
MPFIIRPKRVSKTFAGLLGAALLALSVPAVAGACTTSATSQPFSKFNDYAKYAPMSGGSFESGTSGWTLSQSAVAGGNESYGVASGSHSLAIQPNGMAVSPAFCVSAEYPSFRFFARQTSGSWGVLNVIIRWTAEGVTHETTSGSLQTGTSWSVSPVMKLGSSLPVQGGGSVSVKLVFKPEQYGGAWAIDDVYIDPYTR